jgi:hypothetical protein
MELLRTQHQIATIESFEQNLQETSRLKSRIRSLEANVWVWELDTRWRKWAVK